MTEFIAHSSQGRAQSSHGIDENREWRLTPIDWGVGFPRSPQHLSNQLRGKKFNAERPQLSLTHPTSGRS